MNDQSPHQQQPSEPVSRACSQIDSNFKRLQCAVTPLIQRVGWLALLGQAKTIQRIIRKQGSEPVRLLGKVTVYTPGGDNAICAVECPFQGASIYRTNRFSALFQQVRVGCSIGKQIDHGHGLKAPVVGKAHATTYGRVILFSIRRTGIQTDKYTTALAFIPASGQLVTIQLATTETGRADYVLHLIASLRITILRISESSDDDIAILVARVSSLSRRFC